MRAREPPTASRGALARLSAAALRSAAALKSEEAAFVADHLYSYNGIPVTPSWSRRLADAVAIDRVLGMSTDLDLQTILEESWLRKSSSTAPGWVVWFFRESGLELGGSGPQFKLYVSPEVEALEQVFPELVRVATSCRALSFKAGADVAGLLRPDKLVVYFSTMGDLASAAHKLARRLGGVPAQGVPFTAEIFGAGLLSWGVDVPAQSQMPGRTAPSWRAWVCYRLAVALIEARKEDDRTEPLWHRTLERLREQGVQVERWLPSPAIWDVASW